VFGRAGNSETTVINLHLNSDNGCIVAESGF